MESNIRYLNSLPVEILETTLQLALAQQSFNTVLVCKAWMKIAQSFLYTNVSIKTLSQLKKFHEVIIHNSYLGAKVKTFDLQIKQWASEMEKIEVTYLLASLLTSSVPKLEVLKKSDPTISYPPLANLVNTQLKHLRRVQQDVYFYRENEDFEDYADCALLMKDRLETIFLRRTYPDQDKLFNEKLNIQYQRLYDSLHQFKHLVDITLTRETNDGIQVFEYVTECCRSLQKIDVHLRILSKSAASIKEISKHIPRSNIKTLKVSTHGSQDDYNLLLYIMHKFTRIQSLNLGLNIEDSRYDSDLFTRLLHYVSRIDEINLHSLIAKKNLMGIIGDFWEKTSKPGSEELDIYCDDCYSSQNMEMVLGMTKHSSGGKNCITTLGYPTNAEFKWRSFMDFVGSSGKFIDTMTIDFAIDDNPWNGAELPEDFFPHILSYCPNLTNLQFKGCVLRQFIYSDINLNKKFSINNLGFDCCDIEPGMLEQLSVIIHQIDQLCLYRSRDYSPDNVNRDEDNIYLNINMPYTKVNRVAFIVFDCLENWDNRINVKVLDTTDEMCYYYQICPYYTSLSQFPTEQEYPRGSARGSGEDRIFFSGPTRPKIEIKLIDIHDEI